MLFDVRGRFTRLASVTVLLGAAACARNPTGPTVEPAAERSPALSARPSPPPPGPVQISFSGDVAGSGAGTATISGSASGNLLVSGSAATYTLTVENVQVQPNFLSACTPDEQQFLVDEGLKGVPLVGTLSLTIDQAADPANISFSLDNVTTLDGKKWKIWSNSTVNYPADSFAYDGTTASANQPFGKLGFAEQVKGNRGINIGCRGSYSVSVTKQ